MPRLEDLARRLADFAEARDWEQFHSPKNLSMALSVEAGELMEHFQWLTEAQSRDLRDEQRARVEAELADVFIYLVRLADQLCVDLIDLADHKLRGNEEKYPVDKARGNAIKYTDFEK